MHTVFSVVVIVIAHEMDNGFWLILAAGKLRHKRGGRRVGVVDKRLWRVARFLRNASRSILRHRLRAFRALGCFLSWTAHLDLVEMISVSMCVVFSARMDE